jgi:ABC-type transport system involved in multi-copper enzyme maturation permease subunit
MTARLSAITLNTFREAVRDRVLYNLVLFVILLVASAPLFSQISIGMERLILINVGLSSISLFGVIIAIFIGIALVSKEIEKRTLYTVLSRPVRRWEFIIGKYLGLLLTLAVNAALMTVGFYIALFVADHGLKANDAPLLISVYLSLLVFLMMTALTLLFSTFSTPVFSAIFAFALFVIGSFADDLRNFAALSNGVTRWLTTAAAYAVPNFASMNVITRVAHDEHISGTLILYNTGYALLYSAAVITAALLIFERRNLK